MKFLSVDQQPSDNATASEICFLVNDRWDDFSFKTAFKAILFDDDGVRHELGGLRILSRGLKHGRVDVPTQFEKLDKSWCSLGIDRDYYLALSKVNHSTLSLYLKAIRDCVADPSIFEAFRNEEGMQASLLRSVSVQDVLVSFPRILRGDLQLTPYRFTYKFEDASGNLENCEFSVELDSKPPTNIHVLIGRNGVGKTRLLAGMADALTENRTKTIGLAGEFAFADDENEFLNVIVVSYSAFDRFDPIDIERRRSKTSIPYVYIGIKKRAEPIAPDALVEHELVVLKEPRDFNREFELCLGSLMDSHSTSALGQRYRRWLRAMEILRSDPGLNDFIDGFYQSQANYVAQSGRFDILSSGHKAVLLTLAKLVENVSDRSLVLIDEPETHLHPPLLGSFIRAVSELLMSQNGVAIVATHSPVVLQEVPAKCVSVISRSGQRVRIRRPGTETFAENVGMLTRKVFGLEVAQSGFYRLLKQAANGRDFDDVIAEFDQQIGGEGRALARVFTTEDQDEENE